MYHCGVLIQIVVSPPNFPNLPQGFDPITYYISLTVSNCCGDSTYLDSIVIEPIPHISFTTSLPGFPCLTAPLPVGSPITIYYNNSINLNYVDTVIINWGDGNIDTILPDCGNIPPLFQPNVCYPDITHSYALIGTYNICITGINECGDSTYCCPINVIPNQVNANFCN